MKEICKHATEKGFKARTFSTGWTLDFYLDKGKDILITETVTYLLLCEIQRWIREELNIHIEVISHKYKIKELNSIPRTFKYNHHSERYSSYEEALKEGIRETLKSI